jgi:hypothetical protein
MTSNDDTIFEFFRWCNNTGRLPGLIVILCLIALHIVGICWILTVGLAHGFEFDCEHTTYSGQWNLSYLRNVSRYCSDGDDLK